MGCTFSFLCTFSGKVPKGVPKAWAVSDAGPPREGFSCIRPPRGAHTWLAGLAAMSQPKARRRSRPPGRLRSYCKAVACSTRPPMALPAPPKTVADPASQIASQPTPPPVSACKSSSLQWKNQNGRGGIRAAASPKGAGRLTASAQQGVQRCLHPFPLWGSHQRPRAHANGRRR